jgi:very-short-patch-repair endonuclease
MVDKVEQSRLAVIYGHLRERLLDLSLRNPMLSYKHRATSKRQLQIVHAIPDQVYRRLVGEDASFDLVPLPDPPEIPVDERTEEFLSALAHAKASDLEYMTSIKALESTGRDDEFALADAERELRERVRKQLGLPPRPTRKTINPADHAREHSIDPSFELEAASTKPEHSARRLHTLKWVETLDAIMEKISDDARLAEQEMGLSTLFLVFGFLEWYEAEDTTKKHFAPLLLLPVTISNRKNAKGKKVYSIVAAAEGADINLSLRKRVQKDFNRILPDFEQEDEEIGSVEAYFKSLTKAISGLKSWKVRRWLTLGHFSFGRFAMYADLAAENWPQHPVTGDLVGPVLTGTEMSGDGGGSILSPPEDYLIDDPDIERLAPILIHDADASQHSALVDVMKGRNLVVQGPPGTGKSQTITNIIANALAQNKTVLFMAEKQAALDVVMRRLSRAKLGEFCLELHSGKSVPRQVVESLKARHKLGYQSRRRTPNPMTADREVTSYLTSLHAEESDGETPFSLIWRSLRARTQLGETMDGFKTIDFPARLVEDATTYAAVKDEVSLYARMFDAYCSAFGRPTASPWSSLEFGDRAGLGIIAGLSDTLADSRSTAQTLVTVLKETADIGVCELADLEQFIALDRALPSQTPPGELINRLTNLASDKVEQLVSLKSTRDEARERCRKLRDLSALDADCLQLIGRIARSAAASGISDQSPEEVRSWARKEIEDCKALQSVIQGFLPVADSVGLGRACWADALESLSVVIVVATKLTEENLAWFRWLPMEGIDAFHAVRSQAAALVEAEGKWRARYPSYGSKRWPTAEELTAVAELLGKGRLAKIVGKLAGDAKVIAALSARLGYPPGALPKRVDLHALASHVQAWSAFLQNPAHPKMFGARWKEFDTPFEHIAKMLSFRNKVKELLLGLPHGDQIFKRMIALDDDKFAKIADAASVIERLKRLSSSSRARLDNRTLEVLLTDLGSSETHAREILILDPEGHLDRFKDPTSTLREAAEAELQERRAEADLRAHTLASTDGDLVESVSAIACTRETLAWIAAVRSMTAPNLLTSALLSVNAPDIRRRISELAGPANTAMGRLRALLTDVKAKYDIGGFDDRLPSKLVERLDDLLSRRGELAEFMALRHQGRRLEREGLGAFLRQFQQSNLVPQKLVDLITGIMCHRRAENVRRTDPSLSQAAGTRLSGKRHEFADRDRQKLERDREIVRNALLGVKPPIGSRIGPKKKWTEMELLHNEFGKETRFTPVRELMIRASGAIQCLKPCFMMSPLSLAKFLPPTRLTFDLLVIDEASQMRPEDAIGGLLRAKQVIVVGDQKQLPPTDFFSRADDTPSSEPAADDDFEDIDDESILEACQKTFRQVRMLRWHYRSRCESLIAFSNKEFYRNDLITFPMARPNSFSVDLVKVGGSYEARRNPAEAQRIAEEAVRFMRRFADSDEERIPTIGLVAVNREQRDLIFEELRRLEAEDPLVEVYREKVAAKGEPVFVKNLENVQGDERDFIFISMTYGPKPGKREVLQRFGPINGKQGHRRLNVLFTRARMRLAIFTSMNPDNVRPAENSSEGVHILRRYLEYAEAKGKGQVERIGDEPDSDFEAEVAYRLRLRKLHVETQVGVSGFKIDLGVRHPDHFDKFIVGIECDGAAYHSTKSARDRDRLREEVLRGLGWEILRVWSTDWFDDPDFQTERLVKQIEKLRLRSVVPYEDYIIAPVYASGPFEPEQEKEILLPQRTIDAADGDGGDIWRVGEAVSSMTSSSFMPTKSGPLSGAEAAQELRSFRDTIIAVEMENWESQRSILRESMIETLVNQRVSDPEDWFRKVPQFQRLGTNAVEKQRYLDRICGIVDRIGNGAPTLRGA